MYLGSDVDFIDDQVRVECTHEFYDTEYSDENVKEIKTNVNDIRRQNNAN